VSEADPPAATDAIDATGAIGAAAAPAPRPSVVDLERIERDLAGVEAALVRLDDGTYWTDEVTGQPLPDQLLADDPVARRQG
jgi:hypothetical protein